MPAQASDATQSTFGTLPDGRAVPAVMLSNANGVSATVIAYGATLQSVILPDKDGNKADVALGYDNLQQYLDKPQYFGGTVGRFANRIAKGRSEEHTSELQSLMRISYAVFCLKKKTQQRKRQNK